VLEIKISAVVKFRYNLPFQSCRYESSEEDIFSHHNITNGNEDETFLVAEGWKAASKLASLDAQRRVQRWMSLAPEVVLRKVSRMFSQLETEIIPFLDIRLSEAKALYPASINGIELTPDQTRSIQASLVKAEKDLMQIFSFGTTRIINRCMDVANECLKRIEKRSTFSLF
jgi:hypothetical protein